VNRSGPFCQAVDKQIHRHYLNYLQLLAEMRCGPEAEIVQNITVTNAVWVQARLTAGCPQMVGIVISANNLAALILPSNYSSPVNNGLPLQNATTTDSLRRYHPIGYRPVLFHCKGQFLNALLVNAIQPLFIIYIHDRRAIFSHNRRTATFAWSSPSFNNHDNSHRVPGLGGIVNPFIAHKI
jgi:hypothetical protein